MYHHTRRICKIVEGIDLQTSICACSGKTAFVIKYFNCQQVYGLYPVFLINIRQKTASI